MLIYISNKMQQLTPLLLAFSMLPLNGNVVHLSLNSLSFNAFQVEASLFNPCNNNPAFGGDSLGHCVVWSPLGHCVVWSSLGHCVVWSSYINQHRLTNLINGK
jgi:hypothetical protein